ncbi:hypothetical protein M404DRAFT_21002 [Pisolithus tinctorius Marx 270]|uniref:Uncharacterized protein n=1 Tax=Pisolithus tinctorius Marx 270 TaxID=870435 RepID=A0A0C3PQG1_PISTI|nr:hypothetical protein M404DRAFT_21002 [Pisolithus tinctorius Marx 270]
MQNNAPEKSNSLETSVGLSSKRSSAWMGPNAERCVAHPSRVEHTTIPGSGVNEAAERVAVRAVQYDGHLKDLDTKLRESLSNFRAIEGSVKDALGELHKTQQRADIVLETDTPRLKEELDKSLVMLQDLSYRLPRIRSRVANIQQAYDSGRMKAQQLVHDLMWLNTDFHERWRLIIFTSSAPVSWRWKLTMRLLFGVAVVTLLWIIWAAIGGAYRAHRQRLLWGERLMS